ncbi:MAG: ThiF family adenylyltransferase [Armatimonadetes bacterium]|nr:ThiF family adenylyltransferase [Armatimonadota bacterium]
MREPDVAEIPRYARQTILPEVGREGQARLAEATVAVMGCGALGSVAATILARSGVGHLRLIDRDVVELHNLQRQVLYNEDDAARGVPKAAAAAERLQAVNGSIEVLPFVADVDHRNIEDLLVGCDVVVDAVDNFESRYLLNDAAVKHGIPWVYGGVIGVGGVSMPILPGDGPCFRCLFPSDPGPGAVETCDTAGILSTIVHIVSAFQATEALKLAMGRRDEVRRELLEIDAWSGESVLLRIHRREDCPVCVGRRFEHLEGERGSSATHMCGRDAVQIRPKTPAKLDLPDLAERLKAVGSVNCHPMLVRLEVEGYQLSIFADGRAIVHGAGDETVARAIYARYVGL